MTDKSNSPFAAVSESLTDGSEVWYVLHGDMQEKMASASSEISVTDLVLQLNAVCVAWVEESPDHIVIEDD